MKRIALLLVAFATVPSVVASTAPASGSADGEEAAIFGVKIPAGYRDWRLISVAHEEGNLNDLRAILGNDVASKAYREKKLRTRTAQSLWIFRKRNLPNCAGAKTQRSGPTGKR